MTRCAVCGHEVMYDPAGRPMHRYVSALDQRLSKPHTLVFPAAVASAKPEWVQRAEGRRLRAKELMA